MKKLFCLAAAVGCVTGPSVAFAETYHQWTGGAGNFLWSDTGNWKNGATPGGNPADIVRLDGAPAGTVFTNDLTGVSERVYFYNEADDYTITGNPLHIASLGWFTTSGYTGAQGKTFTFDVPVFAMPGTVQMTPKSGMTLVFNYPLGTDFATPTDSQYYLGGAGATNVYNAGIRFTNYTTDSKSRLAFKGGTHYFCGDLDVPWFSAQDNSHVIVSNADVKVRHGNTFLQSCTFDLYDGRFSSEGGTIFFAQDAKTVQSVNIRKGGVLAPGAWRPGSDGHGTLHIWDGGKVEFNHLDSSTGCYGQLGSLEMHLHDGAEVATGSNLNGTWRMIIGYTGGSVVNPVGETRFAMEGGLLKAAGFKVTKGATVATTCPNYIVLNGGTIRIGADTASSGFFTASSPATLTADDLIVSAGVGGLTLDTNEFNTRWNVAVTAADGADAADIPFTKTGVGTLTVDADCTAFGGTVTAAGGVLRDVANYLAPGALVLARGGVFAFGTAATDVETVGNLAFAGGTLRLVCGSGNAAQKVAATGTVSGAANFELVDAGGAAFTTVGEYTLLAGEGIDAAFAAKCRVPGGAANRVYAFSADDGALKLVISEGTNPDRVAGEWGIDADGVWSADANWNASVVPNGIGHAATFGSGITADRTVEVDEDVAVGSLVLDNAAASYTIGGVKTVSLEAAGEQPTLEVKSGHHTISAPIVAPNGFTLKEASGASVDLVGPVSGRLQLADGATLASSDPSGIAYLDLHGGALTYTGAGTGEYNGRIYVDAASKIGLAEGAGSLVLRGPLFYTTVCASKTADLRPLTFLGRSDAEIVFSGDDWRSLAISGCTPALYLDGGRFRFASDLRMSVSSSYYYALRLGSVESSGRPASVLTIEDGADVALGDIQLYSSDALSPVIITQGVAAVRQTSTHSSSANDAVCFNGSANITWVINGGSFAMSGANQWFGFRGGVRDLFDIRKGGSATLQRLSLMYVPGTGYGGGLDGLVRVTEGSLAVNQAFLVRNDFAAQLNSRRVVVGDGGVPSSAVLSTVPTYKRTSYDTDLTAPPVGAAIRFDGGTLKAKQPTANSGSAVLTDFLGGFDTVSVGAGGAAVDTAGLDVTVTQSILAGGDRGDFVKTGAGTLTLAGAYNAPMGTVRVKEGTLKAKFSKDVQTAFPEGLVAAWTFDGEDPLRDVSGRGHDLAQIWPENPVVFTNENALAGRSALWTNGVSQALMETTITSLPYKRHTVSLWVRLATTEGSYPGFISTRCKQGMTGSDNGFCLLYKESAGSHYVEIENAGINIPAPEGQDLLPVGEWHMLTMVDDDRTCRNYVDGKLVASGMCTSLRSLMSNSGDMITLGRNHSGGENMSKGGMMDDVAIWGRCLSGEEIAAMYAAQHRTPVAGIDVAAGATLDLDGGDVTAPVLAGAGTVANGAVTVTEKLAPTADTLSVGELVLGEGGVVDFGVEGTVRYHTRDRITLAHFETLSAESESNFLRWTAVNTGADPARGEFKLGVDRTTNTLYAEFAGAGLLMIVR